MSSPTPPSPRRAASTRGRRILCGTDFSPEAKQSAEAAAAMAKRIGEPLVLAHAVEAPVGGASGAESPELTTDSRRQDLRKEAEDLRKTGVEVEVSTPAGRADEALCEMAEKEAPRLIVVASQRRRRAVDRWLLGSVVERTALRAPAPTLVVRNAAPLIAWARGERPLTVFVCFNFTVTSQAALRWVKELRAIGPCQVVIGYVDWPVEQHIRLGGAGPLPFDEHSPDVQALLERDLRARVDRVLGKIPFRLRVEANSGRTDARLAEIAREEAADLLVVGSHQYHGFERLWHTSVSRGLLHEAEMNVAVVPRVTAKARTSRMARPVSRVLVSTDFSDMANAAIPHAYSILRVGGTVHLLHFRTPIRRLPGGGLGHPDDPASVPDTRGAEECTAKLRALIPADAADEGIHTQLEVVENCDVAEAICQAASRLGIDVICLGSHGRSGLAKAITGSVTQAVMERSRRKILIVRPPAD